MAEPNGISLSSLPDSTTSWPNTGKRKRSESFDASESRKENGSNVEQNDRFQQCLREILQLMRKRDPLPSLLKHPLPPRSSPEPSSKRLRLTSDDKETDSIESRIESGAYSKFESLIHDVDVASSSILDGLDSKNEYVNGERASMPDLDSKARSQILIIKQAIDKILRQEINRISVVKDEGDKEDVANSSGVIDSDAGHERGLVLTLNSVTEKGPKPLYSGLQRPQGSTLTTQTLHPSSPSTYADIDAKILPNGMTVIEPVALHAHRKLKESRDKRTIGEVFPPRRSLKNLETPQPLQKAPRDSPLEFVGRSGLDGLEKVKPVFKSDYKFASLPTGQWLQYKDGTIGSRPDSDARRRQRDQSLSGGESKSESDHEETSEQHQTKVKALFQAAYSSFAPIVDNSNAVIPATIRSQVWWERAGRKRLDALISSVQYPEADLDATFSSADQVSPLQDDFEEAVANFKIEENPLSTSSHGKEVPDESQKDTEELLAEVSALLETLSSYQRIRNLTPITRSAAAEVPKTAATSATPSTAELDTYEILKTQLTLLIDSLPPFAIAKLNGDQLAALNIGTKMLVESYDYPGTMEPDEQTLLRRRAAAVAAAAASRTAAIPATRPGYGTPAAAAVPAANYNRGAYGANSSRPPYQQPARQYATPHASAPSYQTPRPPSSTAQRPSYGQQPYQQTATPAYPQGSTVQHFQRPVQNGYGSYSGTPSQPGYAQRPSQPGYQQRAQDSAQNYGRSASPQKPVQNGQQPYYPTRQPQPPQPNYATPRPGSSNFSVNEQQAAIERTKLAQQQHLQRQSSGTPQTPGYGYDGAERRETPNVAPVTAGTA